MKPSVIPTLLLAALVLLASCGTSQKTERSPIATYVMPCSEYVSSDGVIRAWGIGRSDSEAAAAKKARAMASAELAAMLTKAIATTTEDYTTSLSNAAVAATRSLLSEKSTQTVTQSLKGAVVVCDRWADSDSATRYTNYVVMELKGDEYLKSLREAMQSAAATTVDYELLEKLFYKNIGATNP